MLSLDMLLGCVLVFCFSSWESSSWGLLRDGVDGIWRAD
jgi:hypothetical protein